MNTLMEFKNKQFGLIRTIQENNKILFCASDVAKALGYAVPRKAIYDHCKGVLKRNILTNGGNQNISFILEGDVYRLIIKSHLSESEKFESWVFDEVLPSIRKTGGYINNTDLMVETYFKNCDSQTKSLVHGLLENIEGQQEQINNLNQEVEYKENIIIGLVDNIDLATKRQRINQIVRKGCHSSDYSRRWNILYSEFEKKYKCNINTRMKNSKEEYKNKLDYIDRNMNKIPQLYEIACKLFENEFNNLIKEWEICK